MITLDQVQLLEEKVESAVEKIQQLQAENDALRNRVQELSNALSTKSEQLNTLEQDQNQIEGGILKALDRLNSIENAVLKSAGFQSTPAAAPAAEPEQPVFTQNAQPVQAEPIFNTPETPVMNDMEDQMFEPTPQNPEVPDFNTEVPFTPETEIYPDPSSEPVSNPGFDIF